jgi:hypothetical protein
MKDNEIATLINETAGQHWGDEAHFQRFAVALEKRFEAATKFVIKLAMEAERENGAAAERQRCARVARQWDVDCPNTNYGGCIARLIEGKNP